MTAILAALRRRRYLWPFGGVRESIQGTDNQIFYNRCALVNVRLCIAGNHNQIIFGAGCYLNHVTFRISGDHHRITLGSGCQFTGGWGSESVIWFEDHHCCLDIGPKSSFVSVHLAVIEPHTKLFIGADCMFASDIDVRTGDSHSILDTATGQRTNPGQNVTIGDHVWVGAHCVILKGCDIQPLSVVATGSVVTRGSYGPGVILAGNPAKVVRSGITWSRDRVLAEAEQGGY